MQRTASPPPVDTWEDGAELVLEVNRRMLAALYTPEDERLTSAAAEALRSARRDPTPELLRALYPTPSPAPPVGVNRHSFDAASPPRFGFEDDPDGDMQDAVDPKELEQTAALAAQFAAESEEGEHSGSEDLPIHQLTYDWEYSSDDDDARFHDETSQSAPAAGAARTGRALATASSAAPPSQRRTQPASAVSSRVGQLVPGSVHSSSSSGRLVRTAASSNSSQLQVHDDSAGVLESTSGRVRGTIDAQREDHLTMAKKCFAGFKCLSSCRFRSNEDDSCLDYGLDRRFFLELNSQTYGYAASIHSQRDVKVAVHHAVWALRKPAGPGAPEERPYAIPSWRLGGPGGKEVCKAAFQAAIGGTDNSHRVAVQLTIAGRDPLHYRSYAMAAEVVKTANRRRSPRKEWAIQWWRRHLLWQDWLPNEMKIQYRGPFWDTVYNDFYLPEARRAALVLKRKQWMHHQKPAIEILQKQFYPAGADQTLTVTRSARHSKFPECTDCQEKRRAYKVTASNPTSTREQIAARHKDMVDHAALWQGDREKAYELRQAASVRRAWARYTVDDKCGSFWQSLPVGWEGRDTKGNAQSKYKFSVHANVLCGEGGVKRFTFVPKNVRTGANFGLTNLLFTILLGIETGSIAPHQKQLVRHTDGGPDNVSVVTHFVHWLLVYLGVFEEVIWFRFKAGHSHTEVADRLFAIIKLHFETDSRTRPEPIHDFPQLIKMLEKSFAGEAEASTFHWNFANFDFKRLMDEMKVVSNNSLIGISSKMVYKYSYSEALPDHGNVLVQYKSNIQWTGNAREAEYSPLRRVEKMMATGEDGETVEKVPCNESTAKGVRFVNKPPDLRMKPRLEPFEETKPGRDKTDPAKQCRSVLRARGGSLPEPAVEFWKCLAHLHEEIADQATRVPDMPYTVSTDTGAYNFDGSPKPWSAVIEKISLRFPRPLLGENPFHSAPAESWQAAKERAELASEAPGAPGARGGEGGLGHR